MKSRTAEDERRSGIHWLIIGAVVLAAMFAMWWLVERTNTEGEHDAQLLPLFALIPLLIGLYHVVRSRLHQARNTATKMPVLTEQATADAPPSASGSVPTEQATADASRSASGSVPR